MSDAPSRNAVETQDPLSLRLTLALTGALSGLSFWVLFDYLPDVIDQPRLLTFLAALSGGFFTGALMLLGRLPRSRALIYAAGLGVIPGLLLFWAGFRFDTVQGYIDSGHPMAAYLVLVSLPLPFILAHETAPLGWRDYEGLFDRAWSLFVRAATAWAFVGLFWLVIFLGDALLRLVNFRVIGDLTEHPWVALPLTGLVLGLALAVLNELAGVVSVLRRLALQLLRLLLPLVAVLVALFIVLVPFQGLEKVFDRLSAAATMLAMAMGAVTLITAAVDARDSDAARSRLMVVSAKALAVLLPIVAGIAVYAIWLRVDQYGWTPDRLLGSILSLIVLVYALGYGISVLAGKGWRDHIRTANIWTALSLIALATLWLSPVLNAERISANNQLARYVSHKTDLTDLDLWAIGREWGRAGQAVITELRNLEDGAATGLKAQLDKLDETDNKYTYRRNQRAATRVENQQSLADLLPVLPVGSTLPDGALDAHLLETEILASCRKELADGRPGCAAVVFANSPQTGATVVLFWRSSSRQYITYLVLQKSADAAAFVATNGNLGYSVKIPRGTGEQALADIQDGKFSFVPVTLQALQLEGLRIVPQP